MSVFVRIRIVFTSIPERGGADFNTNEYGSNTLEYGRIRVFDNKPHPTRADPESPTATVSKPGLADA